MITKFLFIFIVYLTGIFNFTFAQVEEPRTPQGKLARSAGAYLGSLEYVRVFKISDCGYALSKKYPSINEELNKEVIFSFSPESQEEIYKAFNPVNSVLASQSLEYVNLIIENFKKDTDRNTACGKASALIATVAGQAKDNWIKNKNLYGK
jgi:hypothetical protein